MNLNGLEQDVYRRLGFATSSVNTDTQTRIRAYLNETQQEILAEPGIERLLNDSVTFDSVASTPEYSLPPVIARIKTIYDTTNRFPLRPLDLADYRRAFTNPTATTGVPDRWVDQGYAAVATQPSDASELFVESTSASDNSTKEAFVEGYITGGYFRSASVALNGVTAASLSSSITTWIAITKFYIALAAGGETTAAGAISLLEDSGSGTELARIPIGGAHSRYRRIALAICPAAAVTYTVDFERDVQSMSEATDEPLLPPRFHRLLAIGARMREYEKQDDDRRYKAAQAEYLFGLKKLKYFLYSQTVGSPNIRGSQPARVSRLGSWFPAEY